MKKATVQIDNAAAETEAGDAQLPVRQFVCLDIPGAVEKVRAQLAKRQPQVRRRF